MIRWLRGGVIGLLLLMVGVRVVGAANPRWAPASTLMMWMNGLTPVEVSATNPLPITISGTLSVANGGTGITTYTIGDLIYASAAGTLAKLADVATGSVLVSGGVGAAPTYSATPIVTSIEVGVGAVGAPAVKIGDATTGFFTNGSQAISVTVNGVAVYTFGTPAGASAFFPVVDAAQTLGTATNRWNGVSSTAMTIGTVTPTAITNIRVYAPSLTPTQIAAAIGAVEQTFTVTGLTTADKVNVNGPAPTALCPMVAARVSAADTLAITFADLTAGLCTPTAGTYTITAIRS